MKILVLSLLRLGDILLHREVAMSLKRQHPGCELHFLIFSQFQSVQALLPEVDVWHQIDRQSIQRNLVERDQSPLAAYAQLEKAVSEINEQNFDLILNATHNRFSVRLMDLFQAQEKRGVALDMGHKVRDGNSWQTYANENFSANQGSRFHYLEVLLKSLGLELRKPNTADFRKPGLILLQLLTSDTKKNWGLQRFHLLKTKLEAAYPMHRVLGLCSPQEKEQVEKVFQWNEFISPSLTEARDLFKEASLLITGDTSLQHLAAQQGCPVVSIFLGSADPVKTAPWQMGAWVIQGKAACAPCNHSDPCHQAEHLCALSLSVESVFDLVSGVIRNEPVRISKARTYQVTANQDSVTVLEKGAEFEMQLEQAVWNSYLNGVPADIEGLTAISQEKLSNLQANHQRFKAAVAKLQTNQINIETIETEFPLWKDSLTRLKHEASAMRELQMLTEIRSQILIRLSQEKEASHVGNSKQFAQQHFAEA